jgi:hypothetical protein
MRIFPLIAASALATFAHAQTTEPNTRMPTPGEIQAFATFYKQRYSTNQVPEAVFSATRSPHDGRWIVQASVFNVLGKGLKNLCHGEEYRYSYGNHDSHRPAWAPAEHGAKAEYVWIGDGSTCGNDGSRILSTTPVPDMDALDLLENAETIKRKYSLLLAGNSGCERVVRGTLKTVAIGVDNNAPDLESMYQITYSTPFGSAEVFLHKKGKDMTPWVVRCTLS